MGSAEEQPTRDKLIHVQPYVAGRIDSLKLGRGFLFVLIIVNSLRLPHLMTQSKAHFNYRIDNDLIIIEDVDGPLTVTQDAERVLADIQTGLGSLEGKYIIWRDIEGTWDALEWNNQKILIYPLSNQNLEEAIKTLRKHLNNGGLHWSRQDNDQIKRQSDQGTLPQK